MNIVAGYNGQQNARIKDVCRYHLRGSCRFGNRCRNVHEIPTKTEKVKITEQSKHRSAGTSQHNIASSSRQNASTSKCDLNRHYGPETSSSREALELVRKAQSANKSCGICFDVILEKSEVREQLFGILPNCNHCYCFACIRKWRQSKEFDFSVAKACPECRVPSEYVFRSRFWYDTKEEKDSFIRNEKLRMQKQHCGYFKKGDGRCPFGNTCLYLHALPDGTIMDVGPPKPRRKRPSLVNPDLVQEIFFWMNFDEAEDEMFLSQVPFNLEIAMESLIPRITDYSDSDEDYEW